MQLLPGSLLVRARSAPGQVLVGAGLVGAVTVAPVVFSPRLYDNFTLPKQSVLLVSAALICVGLALDGQFLPSGRWLRIGLVAWVGWLTVSWLAGIDRWGSILGYYQYRQGYLTQLVYVTCLLGALSLARQRADRWLPIAGLAGLSGVLVYTAIQALGIDPVDWWVDTSERTIGTIGNANELAAYALVGLAFAGSFVRLGPRRDFGLVVAITAVVSFIILETESRIGTAALVLAIVVFPLVGLTQRLPPPTIRRHLVALLLGSVLGLLLGFLAGSVAGTASRVANGDSDAAGSTRVALWRGTLPVITASPVLGYGPDGLALAFPQHRPADLGGVFKDYDLVAQSSHNWLLDTAANTGIVGLAAFALLLGSIVMASVRAYAGKRDAGFALRLSALAAYAVLTLFNPISMAAHALFFILLGTSAGRGEPPALAAPRRQALRLSAAAIVALPLVAIAVALPVADVQAHFAWSAYAQGNFTEAARHYHDAERRFPVERDYASREAGAWLAAGVSGDTGALQKAEQRYIELDQRFGFSNVEALGLAAARIGLREPPGQIFAAIDRAVALNPHGLDMAKYAATLREAALSGNGILRYWEEDRSVYVALPGEPERH